MLDLTSISSQLLFSTTRFVGQLSNGTTSIGTGFFFHFKADNQNVIPVLITNKHVVKDVTTATFFVHTVVRDEHGQAGPSENSYEVTLTEFQKQWIGHPDENVDLCAIPIGPLHNGAREREKEIFYITIDESLIPTQEQLKNLVAMEDVTMVGYPIGLWDHVNNLPLLRRGITSTHPFINFQGKSEGVLDIALFPGSSGSPIFILNEGTLYSTPDGFNLGNRYLFLGIAFAHPRFEADGSISVEDIPTALVPKLTT